MPAPKKKPPPTFVQRLAAALAATPAASGPLKGTTGPAESQVAAAANLPELFTFPGFLGAVVAQPGVGKQWQLMYLDLGLKNWLLVEEIGIVTTEEVLEDKAPDRKMDVLWVTADTAVGRGSGSQSLEAQFLTGEFTRAADFRSSPRGGTLAAATGVFCDAESIGCCRPTPRG
jgi:hypothetical protein